MKEDSYEEKDIAAGAGNGIIGGNAADGHSVSKYNGAGCRFGNGCFR